MKREHNEKASYFGASLLLQLFLHCARSAILNLLASPLKAPPLSYLYGVITLLLTAMVFLLPVYLYLKLSGTKITALYYPINKHETGEKRKDTKKGIAALQFIFAAAITLNAVNLAGMATDAVCRAANIPLTRSSLPDDIGLQIISFISAVIFAPILEELLFRGVALNALSQSKLKSIPIVGALFALMHYNSQTLLYAFCAGCIIAYFALKTNHLLVAVGLHLVNNLVTFISLLLSTYAGDEASKLFGYIMLAVTLPIAIIGIILLIRDHIPSYKSALGHKTDNEDTNYPTAPHDTREEKSSPPLPFSREILLYAVLAALLCAFG